LGCFSGFPEVVCGKIARGKVVGVCGMNGVNGEGRLAGCISGLIDVVLYTLFFSLDEWRYFE